MVTIEVLSPATLVDDAKPLARRLPDLRERTVCEVADGVFEHHRTFPRIRAVLQSQFPGIKIIPYTEFPVGITEIDIDEIGAMVKAKGGEAAIIGNAR